jgi:two-component system NtrC family sensor kinase
VTPRVLIVDDSLTVRMDLGEALEVAGFAPVLVSTLAAARAAVVIETFLLIILDVVLPDGDGTDFLHALKSEPATQSIPVMLLTTEVEVRDRVRGLRMGADAYIGKPYDTEHVIARAKELARSARQAPSIGAPTVLVIDDSPTFCEALREAFESMGLIVVTADTGEQGLRVAADVRPAAIVVDGMLPGIDGPTVIRRLRADATLRRTPCLLLTAADDLDSEIEGLDAGADAYVRKTHDLGEIMARLSALLRSAGTPSHTSETTSLLAPKRILAIDDSRTYLEALAEQLRTEGYDVIMALSGADALELLTVQKVDCILLDMLMPNLSGEETCRRIKMDPALRDVPIIMLTARDDREAMIEGINAGADDFIAKSSDFEVLKARLRAQLRRRQFEEENRGIREQLMRRELEATEARSARALAERESAFKSKFLASMSHELRTPLNAIIGFSELMEQGLAGSLTDVQQEFVHNVLTSGQHLLTLINEILDLSKIEAGKTELKREWAPIEGIVEAVRGVIAPLADAQGVRIVIAMTKGLPAVYVDPVRIKQVLYNLLSNGIKFTPRGGEVALEVAAQKNQLTLVVRDTGIGIRESDIGRLFREFEQIEPTDGVKPQGTGLGLALTRRLIELHSGTISVRSTFGQGTTFTVTLPMQRRADGSTVPSTPPEARAGEDVVLVVEDDPVAAELIAGHVRAAGLGVRIATNADDAIRVATEHAPAAITLDLLMPGVDGWSILTRLKATPATAAIPVVIVSVVDDPGRGLLLGATDYLVKPVTREGLLGSLESVGVTLRGIAGVHVLLVGSGNGELGRIEAHLRGAGCQVRRSDVLTEAALTRPDVVDIALVDVSAGPLSDVPEGVFAEAHARAIPIVSLLDPSKADDRQAQVDGLRYYDALEPNRLVRAVRHAADHGRLGIALWHAGTGLPSAAQLESHLREVCARVGASSCVVVACVPIPVLPGPMPWARSLRRHLPPSDFVAVADDGALALVARGTREEAPSIAARFEAAIRLGLALDVTTKGYATSDADTSAPGALLACALARAYGRNDA